MNLSKLQKEIVESKENKIVVMSAAASGKTAVSNYLQNNYPNYEYIDTDLLSHEILEKPETIEKIKNNFGSNVIENEQVNRKKLGSIIFNNKEEKEKLNSIIHPEVIKEVKRRIKKSDKKIIFVIVPLLFEAKMDDMMDEIWYVHIPYELQINRLMSRDNIDYEYAVNKINSQMSYEEKRKIMSKKQNVVLIDNSFDLCYTYESILKLMKEREN